MKRGTKGKELELGLVLFFLFLTAAMLVVAAKTIRIVPQATVMMVERLGRFRKLANSGLQILVPFIDKPRGIYWTGTSPGLSSIDMREQFLDMPLQAAITRDNVQIVVDAVVYWQITDPIKSVYEVVDLKKRANKKRLRSPQRRKASLQELHKAGFTGGKLFTEPRDSIENFHSNGARRGNQQVMVRGTFANLRIKKPEGPGSGRRLYASSAQRRSMMLR